MMMMISLRIARIVLVCVAICGATRPNVVTADEMAELVATVRFNRDIRPILAAACYQCHGPDQHKREADLRLDTAAGIAHAFGDGALADSEAWQRISSSDDEQRMPPADAERQLTASEIATIRQWLQDGAEWQGHWAFIAPVRPDLPAGIAKVDATSPESSVSPIDHFIDRRLQTRNWHRSTPADRERTLRRLTFDLTGLPPTLDELDAFLADERPDAYERTVDRLLASDRFGERMAVAWLDAARYGDTSVFHGDGPRDMWAWRDWVINAYNSNMPYDQFTVEQLAGDLIPEATVEQKIASGFNRNNATTDEGGAIAEEFRVEYAVDRVKTTSIVWLGLTMECAQCHDHKYDPISQEEYYKFFAYFNQSADAGMQTRNGNAAPIVDVPNYKTQAELATIRQQLRRVEQDRAARQQAADPDFQAWLVALDNDPSRRETPLNDLAVHFRLDEGQGDVIGDSAGAARNGKLHGEPEWANSRGDSELICDDQRHADLGDLANFERTDAYSYGIWLKPGKEPTGAPIARMNDDAGHRGFDLHLAKGNIEVHIVHQWPDNALKVVTQRKLEPDTWQHVLVTYDGSSKAAGIKIYVNGQSWEVKAERDQLTDTIRTDVPLRVGRRHNGSPYHGAVDDLRIYTRELESNEVDQLAAESQIAPLFAKSNTERTETELATLRERYFARHDAICQQINADLAQLKARETEAAKPRGTLMVMADVPESRATYVLMRGNYASPLTDKPLLPGVPAALSAIASDAPANRLGLAKWLVDRNNPLTARVAVNRHWMMFFGTGLVGSVEDFGSQGEYPSHPDLLDWLAVDFVENGWDVKRLVKQMVMSQTYRQTSRVAPAVYEADPANRLLARGPRFRLQGEFIRDNALAASGLLVGTIGGPSVKPYQPAGLWNEVSIDTNLRFSQDHGENLYRRSMYIYWKRSAPPPTMAIFDAPSRESCTIRRSRTNTPMQALVTLNDPQFVEAARVLAERVLGERESSPIEQIRTAHRLVTGIRPTASVLEILNQAYRTELAVFQAVPERAQQLLAVGEAPHDSTIDEAQHAAMTIVVSMILNLDEALTRG